MATRIYTDPADFDLNQAHFTIEVVDNQYYLRIGALNSEDQRLITSLIEDGFVGFFQDDVKIAIAGIASIYDATNDRIEIDRELPELKIEDEYVIRFTQARPGEDGEGGIGTPGEDGEHAEIEVEDTDTGIRVRGKSGGEPDFGPWQDVRDGIDGQDGIDGEQGQDGEDGRHAEIEVEDTPPANENAPGIRVRGKSGGETDFGEWYYVQDGKDGKDGESGQDGEDGEHAEIEIEDTNTGIRVRGKSGGELDFGPWQDVRDGIDGEPGEDGEDGDDGWSPVFAIEADGATREVLKVVDWTGGEGTKPAVGKYIGTTGFVDDIAGGVNIRGTDGEDGEDGQDGRDGEDGTDGIGNVQFSRGIFTPRIRNIIYHRRTADGQGETWSWGGEDRNYVSVSGESGKWMRWGNDVLFSLCFTSALGSSLPDGCDRVEFYFDFPQGSVGTPVHGTGCILDAGNADLFFVYPRSGDRRQRVNPDGTRYIQGNVREVYNAISVWLISPNNGHNGNLEGLVSVMGIYRIPIT